ncbi:MAG: SDR family oxidoreductase [Janthinobacterium lividum]
MDLVLTGATGFVGSHLALGWLRRDPAARIGCLVRAADAGSAQARLHAALRDAAFDDSDLDGLLARADAIPGCLEEAGWIGDAQAWMRSPAELVHCAANLSFRESDRAAVWRSNVDGTKALLRALPGLQGLAAFNYISTAYVAGDRQGDILEGEHARPQHFNNPYEESKWVAEGLVREGCAAAGVAWRVLRPSIVIAHSVTHRMSSHSGFYHVVDTLLQLGRHKRLAGDGPVLLPVAFGTTLDLIPVDVVAGEIVALIAAGGATTGQNFHVTPADPLLLADVLRQLTPMSGMAIEINGPATPLSPTAQLVMRRLRYYAPYFAFRRRFDRRGTQAALGGVPYRLTLDELRGFVRSYLAQQESPASGAAT